MRRNSLLIGTGVLGAAAYALYTLVDAETKTKAVNYAKGLAEDFKSLAVSLPGNIKSMLPASLTGALSSSTSGLSSTTTGRSVSTAANTRTASRSYQAH